jgi:hypothetical protein
VSCSVSVKPVDRDFRFRLWSNHVAIMSGSPISNCAVEPSGTTPVDTSTLACANQPMLHSRHKVCSDPASPPISPFPSSGCVFPSTRLPICLALGDIGIPYPPPLLPISKGLTRFLPMYPHAPMLQIKALTEFLPISSPFLASKTQNATVPRCGYFQVFAIAQSPAFCATYLTLTDRRLSYYSK